MFPSMEKVCPYPRREGQKSFSRGLGSLANAPLTHQAGMETRKAQIPMGCWLGGGGGGEGTFRDEVSPHKWVLGTRKKNKGDYGLYSCAQEQQPREGRTSPGLPAPQAQNQPERGN